MQLIDQFLRKVNYLRVSVTDRCDLRCVYCMKEKMQISNILKHPNVYNFIHIPVQSGSNHVLEAMKREYTIEEFESLVDYLKQNNPGITIMTDIICGFPNENESDFRQTIQLIEKYKFPLMNYTQFYSRKGTPAAKMIQLPAYIAKNRTKEIDICRDKCGPKLSKKTCRKQTFSRKKLCERNGKLIRSRRL